MVDEDQILTLIRQQGPSIPVQISKKIGQNILFSSAILGELSSKGKLKISSVKIGGTPLYYLPGQESRLQEYSKYLNEKDQRTYEKLKRERIIKDSDQEPIVRISLRAIKDFAVPLEVSFGDRTEIFWKWYLMGKDEAETEIRKIIGPAKSEPAKKEEAPKVKKDTPREPVKEEPKQEKLAQKLETTEAFTSAIDSYFKSKKVEIIEQNIVRKASDIEFVVSIPSNVGTLKYFVKARSKKNNNDADLSSAFLQGQRKNLPVIYLTTGKVTKKGKLMAQKEFPSMLIEEI